MNVQRIFGAVLSGLLSNRLLLLVVALFALNGNPQAEVVLQGLGKQGRDLRTVMPQINQAVQGYFRAVAAGDTESALAVFYPWEKVGASQMPVAINAALLEAGLIKKQIDDNKGIKRVEVVSSTGGDAQAEVVVEVEFNNGFKDISGAIPMAPEYAAQGWTEDFKLGHGTRRAFPIVGMRAALKTAEVYYAAALAGDFARMKKLTYHRYLLEKSTSANHVNFTKELERYGASLKTIIAVNGGIKNLEVPNVLHSESKIDSHHKKGFNDEGYQRLAAIKVNYHIHYGNGKTEQKQGTFVLDDRQWKVLNIK